MVCYGLKKIHTRNLITKKNSCGSKIPLPPLTFLMVRPLHFLYIQHLVNMDSFYAPLSGGVSLYKQQKTDNEWLVAYGMTLIRVY